MKGQSQTRLKSEIADGKRRPKLFFYLILGFLASTSWVFGSVYLRPLWVMLIGGLPLSESALGVMYAVLGGLSGVLLTTFATNRWNVAKLYAATTGKQFNIAFTGEVMSFTADLIFSVVGLLTLIGGAMSADMRIALEWVAIFLFIGLTCAHAILHQLFIAADVDVWKRATATYIDGKKTSERLTYERTVSRQGLLKASEKANGEAEDYAERLGIIWRDDLLSSLPVSADRPMLPSPTHQKDYSQDWSVMCSGKVIVSGVIRALAYDAARRTVQEHGVYAEIYFAGRQADTIYPTKDDVVIHPYPNGTGEPEPFFGQNGRG